jgi:hypothetical protein
MSLGAVSVDVLVLSILITYAVIAFVAHRYLQPAVAFVTAWPVCAVLACLIYAAPTLVFGGWGGWQGFVEDLSNLFFWAVSFVCSFVFTGFISFVIVAVRLARFRDNAVFFNRPQDLRRHLRRRRGLCERCGYDVKYNTSGVCPECGHVVNSK